MRHPFTRSLALLIVAVLTLGASCQKSDPFIVSGESLDRAAGAFLITARAWDAALDAKLVSNTQYNDWKRVGLIFQQNFRPAVETWRVAVRANDLVKQHTEEAKLRLLVGAVAEAGVIVGVQVYQIIQARQ